jgi:hypothetical protein
MYIYWILHVKICITCRINPRTLYHPKGHRPEGDLGRGLIRHVIQILICNVHYIIYFNHAFDNTYILWKFWFFFLILKKKLKILKFFEFKEKLKFWIFLRIWNFMKFLKFLKFWNLWIFVKILWNFGKFWNFWGIRCRVCDIGYKRYRLGTNTAFFEVDTSLYRPKRCISTGNKMYTDDDDCAIP